jgi:hypothetical protein
MSLTLRWRVPDRRIITRWRGPSGLAERIARNSETPVAAIIGPPGPPGSAGAPQRLNASLASTWVLNHALGRVPAVQVYLSSGEPVITDVAVTSTQITVTFPSPQQGFVLAF